MNYDAIVGFAVGQKAEGSAWGTLVKTVCGYIAEASEDYTTDALRFYVETRLGYAEADYKKDMNESALPTTYRTAKCVVLKAVEKGIALMEGGEPVGKTAIEKKYKEAAPKNEKDLIEHLHTFLRRVDKETDADMRITVVEKMKEFVDAYYAS